MNRRSLSAAALAIALLLLVVAQADAGGPGTGGRRIRLEDEPAGPYLLRVVTSPTPPRVESLYLEVRVQEATTGEIVTDARVVARAEFLDGKAPPIEQEATHAIAPNPVEYGVHLPVSEAGRWQILVRVEGDEGRGEVGFEERVSRPTSVTPILVVGLPLAGLGLLVGVFLGLQRQRGRGRNPGQG